MSTKLTAENYKKNTTWIPVNIELAPIEQGGYKKTMSGPSKHVDADGNLDFSKITMPVIVAFSLDAPAGVRFPSDTGDCIEIQEISGNGSGKKTREIFTHVAISNNGLLLVLVDENPRKSGTWSYTLFVEVNGNPPVSIDPMIINRSD